MRLPGQQQIFFTTSKYFHNYISQADDYKLGNCGIRWAFALAIIALFDVTILGCLAYTLATKKIKEWILGPHLMTYDQTSKFGLH